MFSDYGDKVPSGKCECYKKLDLLGIPLYISEETDEYAESYSVIPYEQAFQLPRVLTINENITEYPRVEETQLPIVFRLMTDVIPSLSDFEINPGTFWILDIFIESLWTAQKQYFSHFHQLATLLWVAYLFNYLQKNNPSRKELFKHLKTVLFAPETLKHKDSDGSSDEMLGESVKRNEKEDEGGDKVDKADKVDEVQGKSVWELVLPPDFEGERENTDTESSERETSSYANSSVTEVGERTESSHSLNAKISETISERNVRHMKIILEILYRVFGRLWVFAEIQTAFHNMPLVKNVELPFTLRTPKPKMKSESVIFSKIEKNWKKMYAAENSPEDIETEKEFYKHDYILPLQESEEAKMFGKEIFGPPASSHSMLTKGKGKK